MASINTTLDWNKFVLDPYGIYKHNIRLEQVCLWAAMASTNTTLDWNKFVLDRHGIYKQH